MSRRRNNKQWKCKWKIFNKEMILLNYKKNWKHIVSVEINNNSQKAMITETPQYLLTYSMEESPS